MAIILVHILVHVLDSFGGANNLNIRDTSIGVAIVFQQLL